MTGRGMRGTTRRSCSRSWNGGCSLTIARGPRRVSDRSRQNHEIRSSAGGGRSTGMARGYWPGFGGCLTLLLAVAGGCQSKYADLPVYTRLASHPLVGDGLEPAQPVQAVDALCYPPSGWAIEPLKTSEDHAHQVWLSPTGKTAYGVIHFGLPLPVPAQWVLDPFLREMKKSEGEAILIGQPMRDDDLPGVRFTVEGGLYKMRVN